jgi:hypothetical protein
MKSKTSTPRVLDLNTANSPYTVPNYQNLDKVINVLSDQIVTPLLNSSELDFTHRILVLEALFEKMQVLREFFYLYKLTSKGRYRIDQILESDGWSRKYCRGDLIASMVEDIQGWGDE